jgi:hypothetical protein
MNITGSVAYDSKGAKRSIVQRLKNNNISL